MEGGTDKTSIVVDTKDNCFLCLKDISAQSSSSSGGSSSNDESTFGFRLLSKYLNLDLQKVFQIPLSTSSSSSSTCSSSPGPNHQSNNIDVTVPLCLQCSPELVSFFKVYKEMLGIVRRIQGVMLATEGNWRLVEECRKRVTDRSTQHEDLVSASLSDGLRKELLIKCGVWAKHAQSTGQPEEESNGIHVSSSSTTTTSTSSEIDSPVLAPPDGTHPPFPSPSSPQVALIEHPDSSSTITTTSNPGESSTLLEKTTFTHYVGGLRQCDLCSCLVSTEDMNSHSMLHNGNKPYKCAYCNQAFSYPKTCEIHVISTHRDKFFTQFRDPRVSPSQFVKIVENLFSQVESGQQLPDGNFSCTICKNSQLTYSQKVNLDLHVMRTHMAALAPRLIALQQQQLQQQGLLMNTPLEIEWMPPVISEVMDRPTTDPPTTPTAAVRPTPASSASSSMSSSTTPPAAGVQYPTVDTVAFSKLLHSPEEAQCHICSSIVPISDVQSHADFHGETGRQQVCPNCQMMFLDVRNLRRHTTLQHQHAFFIHYRDPRIHLDSFARLVLEMFEGFQFIRDSERGYQCFLCTDGSKWSRRKVDGFAHLIHDHTAEIGFQIITLQQNALAQQGEVMMTQGQNNNHNNIQNSNNALVSASAGFPLEHQSSQSLVPVVTDMSCQLSAQNNSQQIDMSSLSTCSSAAPVVCHICGELFASHCVAELNRHMTIHVQSSSLDDVPTCHTCSMSFPDLYHLRNHLYTHHTLRLFSKYKATGVTSDQRFVEVAMRLIRRRIRREEPLGGYSLTCGFCKNWFRSELDVGGHIVGKHLEDIGGELVAIQNGSGLQQI